MKEYKCEGWRTCNNCIHKDICKIEFPDVENCTHHIYNANPERYGDFNEILENICLWLKTQYPNDTILLIDKNSAKLLINKSTFYTKEFTDFSLGGAFQKMQEEIRK